ncbi:MAG: hypothetical protein CVV27_15255 [Candidatus Melainabacteria bacterium HGW-Melainabacteria-1]|nr:MAG: hypothetical protein CVV27_15255 [Candidatus Melainabacteria bacterium HGW-Melainabacteria-1]
MAFALLAAPVQAAPVCLSDYSIQTILAGKPGQLYVGSGEAGLLYSPDGGRSWSVRGPRNAGVNALLRLESQTLLMGSDDGLLGSHDDGKHWQHLGLKGYNITSLAKVPGQQQLIWVGTPAGLYRYDRSRQSWQTLRPDGSYEALLSGPALPTLAGGDGPLQAYTPDSWNPLVGAPAKVTALHPTRLGILAASRDKGLRLRTTGATWHQAGAGLPQSYQMVRDFAGSGDRVFALLDAQGIWRSENGGIKWSNWSQGLESFQNTLQGFALSGDRAYVGSFHQGLYVRHLHGAGWVRADRPCQQLK